MERESFVFYRSFFEAISLMPTEVQTELYPVICQYALFGRVPENLSPMAKAIFILMKPNIDTNTTRYENGKKGGRKKKQPTQQDSPTPSQPATTAAPATPAPTSYEASYEEECEQMKSDEDFRSAICQEYSISAKEYEARLSRFLFNCKEGNDKTRHDCYDDCKRHFRYWMDKAYPASPPPAPTYNPSYEEECEQMKSDRAWNQQQCMQLQTDEAALHALIDRFKYHCMKNKRRHDSLRDAEFHFISWLQTLKDNPNENSILPKSHSRGRVPQTEPSKYFSDSF